MTVHSMLTGNPFEIDAQAITIVWPAMGLEGTEVSRDGDKITCLESLDEMQELLKAAGLKFARVQYLEYDWAYCLINTSKVQYLKVQYLEAKRDTTKIQVGFDFDGEVIVDLPIEQVLDLLAAARR